MERKSEANLIRPDAVLTSLIEAAQNGEWDMVDGSIHKVLSPAHMEWAAKLGLSDENDDVRDLAATMFEESLQSIPDELRNKMYQMIQADTNNAVRYRLAFALYKRGDHIQLIQDTVEKAAKEPELAAIAKRYLDGDY